MRSSQAMQSEMRSEGKGIQMTLKQVQQNRRMFRATRLAAASRMPGSY
jgi:hypothetical protein